MHNSLPAPTGIAVAAQQSALEARKKTKAGTHHEHLPPKDECYRMLVQTKVMMHKAASTAIPPNIEIASMSDNINLFYLKIYQTTNLMKNFN